MEVLMLLDLSNSNLDTDAIEKRILDPGIMTRLVRLRSRAIKTNEQESESRHSDLFSKLKAHDILDSIKVQISNVQSGSDSESQKIDTESQPESAHKDDDERPINAMKPTLESFADALLRNDEGRKLLPPLIHTAFGKATAVTSSSSATPDDIPEAMVTPAPHDDIPAAAVKPAPHDDITTAPAIPAPPVDITAVSATPSPRDDIILAPPGDITAASATPARPDEIPAAAVTPAPPDDIPAAAATLAPPDDIPAAAVTPVNTTAPDIVQAETTRAPNQTLQAAATPERLSKTSQAQIAFTTVQLPEQALAADIPGAPPKVQTQADDMQVPEPLTVAYKRVHPTVEQPPMTKNVPEEPKQRTDSESPELAAPTTTPNNGARPKTRPTSTNSKSRTSTSCKTATPAASKAIMKLLMSLSGVMHECVAIRGASPNKARTRLVLDIEQGKDEIVRSFLQRHYPDAYQANQFYLKHQRATGTYLVGVGKKVVNANSIMDVRYQRDPGAVTEHYGTVTCLAKDDNNKLYVLTSNHVIHHNRPPRKRSDMGLYQQLNNNEGDDSFLSVHHNQLCDVSTEFQCIFHSRLLPSFEDGHTLLPYNIDIAALKLSDAFTGFSDDRCGCGFRQLPPVYDGCDDDLEGIMVVKNGAASGITCGRVLLAQYLFPYPDPSDNETDDHNDAAPTRPGDSSSNETDDYSDVAPTRPGMGLIVESLDPDMPFAEPGDSGSLVWSSSGEPIGVVSYHFHDFEYEDPEQQEGAETEEEDFETEENVERDEGSRTETDAETEADAQTGAETEADDDTPPTRVTQATYVVYLSRCIQALEQEGMGRLRCHIHGSPVPIQPVAPAVEPPNVEVEAGLQRD